MYTRAHRCTDFSCILHFFFGGPLGGGATGFFRGLPGGGTGPRLPGGWTNPFFFGGWGPLEGGAMGFPRGPPGGGAGPFFPCPANLMLLLLTSSIAVVKAPFQLSRVMMSSEANKNTAGPLRTSTK